MRKSSFLQIFILISIYISLSIVLFCSKATKDPDDIVAQIDDFTITLRDFNDQLSRTQGNLPLEKIDSALKRKVLDEMIGEQISLFEAYRLGYDKDEKIMAVAKEKEKEIAAQALRQQEIDDQILNENVLKRFYRWSDRDLDLSYMKFYAGPTTEGQNKAMKKADGIYQRLLKGENFKVLAVAFSEHGNVKQDSGKIGIVDCFNAQEPFFENAYPLSPGQVCKPFFANNSVWILKVEKVQPKSLGSYEQERTQILQKGEEFYGDQLIIKRNEFNKAILAEYHYSLSPENIDFFCLRSKNMKIFADTAGLFSANEKNKVLAKNDVEVTTIGFLFSLGAPNFWSSLNQKRVVEMLLEQVNINRLVKNKAMQLEVNQLANVKEEHQSWLIYYLKKMVIEREVIDKIEPSDPVLQSIYEKLRPTLIVKKMATVREIFRKTQADIDRMYQLAMAGNDFAALEKKYSENMADRTNGIIGPFPPGPNGKLGELAFSGMKAGGISRPFKYRGGFSIIQLLAIEPERVKTFQEAREELKAAYIEDHWQQKTSEWQNKAKNNYRIRISL